MSRPPIEILGPANAPAPSISSLVLPVPLGQSGSELLPWLITLAVSLVATLWVVRVWRQGQRRAEAHHEALQRQREIADLLEVAGRVARVGGWSIDLTGNQVYWSDEVALLHEVTPGTTVSLSEGINYYAPEHRARIREVITACATAGTPFDEELQIVTAKGRRFWARAMGRAIRNSAGRITRLVGSFQDISHFKEADAALRQSEARLRLALNAANQGLYDLNLLTGEAVVSAEYATMLGYAPAEFEATAAAWLGRLHPEDRARTEAVFADCIAGRAAEHRLEFRLRTKDGKWRWILSIGRVVEHTTDGRPSRMLGTHTDITVPKENERKIERLSRFGAALIRCNEAIVRSTSEEQLLADVCRHAVELGRVRMAWVGLVDSATLEIRPVASAGEGTDYLDGIRITAVANDPFSQGPTGTAVRENSPCWCDDFQRDPRLAPWRERGARFGWVSSAALPLLRDGLVVGAFTLYTGTENPFDADTRVLMEQLAADIGMGLSNFSRERNRQETEAALRRSEADYRMLFFGMMDGFATHEIICDAAGRAVDYRFVSLNPAFEQMTGLRSADVIGRTYCEIFPHGEKIWIERYGRVALTGEPVEFEEHSAPLRRTFSVKAFRPKPGQFAVVFVDITARRQAEETLQASLREKEALLKEVHHRVKNNLQVITSLLRLEGARHHSPDTSAIIADMTGRIRSMALLHEALYRSSSLAAIDMAGYLRQIGMQIWRTQGSFANHVQLHYDVAPVHLEIDQALPCGLIVNELASNSLKHGFPRGRSGRVTITLRPEPDGLNLLLRVSDDGVGLPPNFDLAQCHSLGMQLVSDLARQLAGRLELGPGATFSVVFSLPASVRSATVPTDQPT